MGNDHADFKKGALNKVDSFTDQPVSPELFFDDEPLEAILDGNPEIFPTPANVIKMLPAEKGLSVDHIKAIVSVLDNHPKDIDLLIKTATPEQWEYFLESVIRRNKRHEIKGIEFLKIMSRYLISINMDTEAFELAANARTLRLEKEFDTHLKIIKSKPDDANALNEFALFLKNECGNFNEAEKYYRLALRKDPTNSIYLNNLAVLLISQRGRQGEAEFYYQRSLKQDPNNANTIANLANFFHHFKNQKPAAEALYLKAIGIDPADPAIRANYAALLIEQNLWVEADEQLLKGWLSVSSNHNHLSARILFIKTALESLRGNAYDFYLGQLKSIIGLGISHSPWSISALVNYLSKKLSNSEFRFFQLLLEAIVKWEKVPHLINHPNWKTQRPIPFEVPWPKSGTLLD